MAGPDSAILCNLINTHTHRHKAEIGEKNRRHESVGSVTVDPDNL